MKVRWASIGGLIGIVAIAGCAWQPALHTRESGIARAEFRTVPIGLCEDYPEESRSLAGARQDLELLRTNGIKVLRVAFGWDAVEPEPGKYEWAFWDEYVRMATEEYGIRLIPYICYTPDWAASVQGPDSWRHPPANTGSFARFVRKLASRYKGRIHSWEIWNEPDNPHYWLGTVEQFGELLAEGSQAVKETDPEATVVLGGLAWNLSFLEALLTNSAWMKDVDVVNLHNYFETWASDPLENLSEYVGRAGDILRRHDRAMPLWMAEIGYSSFRSNNFVSPQFYPLYGYEHTAEYQADALFRALTLLLATERVDLVAWYRINDLPPAQEVIGDVNNRHLGVLGETRRSKPALAALNWVQRLFEDGYDRIEGAVRVTSAAGSDAEVHAFKLADGRIAVTAWLRTVVPGERGGGGEAAMDKREEVIEITLPCKPAGAVRVYDTTGHLISEHTRNRTVRMELRGGSTRILVVED